MHEAFVATSIMTGLGVFFGTALAIASRFLRVSGDARVEEVEDQLPGSNCGACGRPGCHAFAEAVVSGGEAPSGCTVATQESIEAIAVLLGVAPGQQEKRVARLHCAGGTAQAFQIAEYRGFESCRAATIVAGGGKGCPWGCLGLGDCARACTFKAIHLNQHSLPVVDVANCIACGDCVLACPRGLFAILPLSHRLFVQCRSPLVGEDARALCRVACDSCGRCVQDAAPGLIRMEENVPVVDYGSGGPATPQATFRCPTGAIRWLAEAQFEAAGAAQPQDIVAHVEDH
jgi:Na+-translocating ferredoxin:NAD+ oxidoreductase subunit B